MGKGGKKQKKEITNPKRRRRDEDFEEEDMDDEIDAFHKQRDMIPLDVDADLDASDENNEQPVFDFEDVNEGGSEEEDDDDDDEFEDDAQLTGLAAKIVRQQKFLRQKMGGVEDETHDDDEEEVEEERKAIWGRKKNLYYSAENVDYELQSSDEDLPAEEEAEVLRLQKEKAKSLSMADFGLEDDEQDESDSGGERTLEDILPKAGIGARSHADKEPEDDTATAYEEIKKDLSSLSREEQMEVVYSSAPELIGLLSELNDAHDQLERKVNPLLSKAKEMKDSAKGGIRYLEVKQALLLAYCQAICFYLLLKSEGQSVRDHPVIARLVEIKNLLDKMKQLDNSLPSDIEDILNQNHRDETETEVANVNAMLTCEPVSKEQRTSSVSTEKNIGEEELAKVDLLKQHGNKQEKVKYQNDHVGLQSLEMLKLRASFEEKLKKKGIMSSVAKTDGTKKLVKQPMIRKLENLDDFDEEMDDKEVENGLATSVRSSKLLQLVKTKANKPKVISGDGDLPKRDDMGERRRKHELRVLARAGIEPTDDAEHELLMPRHVGGKSKNLDGEDETEEESEDEFYKQVKRQRIAKLSAKAELYSRKVAVQPSEETELVDGKRQISYQIEKNRGLTRNRKKLTKNPRKKYKLKHQKALVRRKGQVREIKKPSGPYGGEASGINAGISRSIRFKN